MTLQKLTVVEITDHLKKLANPEVAEHSQRFFKTAEGEYGAGDQFLGIRVPVIRKVIKTYQSSPLSVAEALLKSPYHEVRLFALLLLVSRFNSGDDQEKQTIYTLYLNNTQFINNWDLVDGSAHHIVGTYLSQGDRSILFQLAKSDLLWERRIAIIATFAFIKMGQFDDSLQIAALLLNDSEDLIHKAVGWMLREVGKKDQAVEEAFLNKHYQTMPRTMLRYAIEKFNEPLRQRYLRGEIC